MSDLSELQSSQSVKIAGAGPSTGIEDNYLDIDSSGRPTVKLNDGGGTSITVGQKTMSSSVPVTIASDQSTVLTGGKTQSGSLQNFSLALDGSLNTNIGIDKSVFGPLLVASRVQQLTADFSESLVNNNITQTVTGTGVVSLLSANASISTGTGTTASAQITTIGSIDYLPGRELYAQYTAAFTTPTNTASTQLTGLYNGTDGLLIGYNGLNFSIATVAGGVSTFVTSSSFNLDTLTGSASSKFTRAGVPEAVNFTYKNVYRLRAGWLGAAPIFFEIMSPDGNWVSFHVIRQPNSSLSPSFLEPSLPFTMLVTKTASDTTNLKITTTSWDAGVVDVSGQTDTSDSGTIAALNDVVVIGIQSQSTIVTDVTGTWVGTIQIEGDVGDGSWNSIYAINTNAVSSKTITSNTTLIVACAGYTSIRLKGIAWTSGSANINWVASAGIQAILAQAVGNVASAQNDVGNPVKVGGVYNSTLPTVASGQRVDLQLDPNGRLLTSSLSVPTIASKFSFGKVVTASLTQVPVEFTTYSEQTTNGQRSLASSNAGDTSAGTGARSVLITYYDQTGAGPFTETISLNGTSTANTVGTNICFIENLKVTSIGSSGANLGIITLYTAINKGGSTITTIGTGDNQTFHAHHYIPTGKICYISGFSIGNNSASSGAGGTFILKASTPTVANTPDIQVGDFCTIAGGDSTVTRNYQSPIQIAGPARIRAVVTPYATSTVAQFASFDFIDN